MWRRVRELGWAKRAGVGQRGGPQVQVEVGALSVGAVKASQCALQCHHKPESVNTTGHRCSSWSRQTSLHHFHFGRSQDEKEQEGQVKSMAAGLSAKTCHPHQDGKEGMAFHRGHAEQ